jgi:hypothetical protein
MAGRLFLGEIWGSNPAYALNEFLEQYPGVSREQAIAALEEAKALVLARFGK